MALLLSELTKHFLDWTAQHRKESTTREYKRHLDRFVAATGDCDVSTLKAHDLLKWGRTWHQIQAVQRLFSWALNDAELVDRNPFRRVKRPSLGLRRRTIDRAVLARLLRESGREFRRFLLVMRETLARPQEVRALRWEYLCWPGPEEGAVTALVQGTAAFVLDHYKASDLRRDPNVPRVIPVSPTLGRLLARLLAALPAREGPVLLNSKGRPWTNNAVRCRMRWLRKRLKLHRDHRGENVVAYTLRHTLATWAAARGVRDKMLAELMGHTTTRTTNRYCHLNVEHLQAVLQKLHARKLRRGFGTEERS